MSRTFPSPSIPSARATTVTALARAAAALAIAMPSAIVPCTTSVVPFATDRVCFTWLIPGTTAPSANFILASMCPAWLPPAVTTPTGSLIALWLWWLRTAYPTEPPPGTSGVTTASLCPTPPSRTGWRRREKKAEPQVEAEYLDWALSDFSGYLAADELYDGPFCVLSVVDARQQRRLLYEVLDHDPTRYDILLFLARLNQQLTARGLVVRGITTDASSLYPLPIRYALGPIPHQICEFHILKELTLAVLRVLAQMRKRLAEQKPKLPRGRPKNTPEGQRLHHQAQAIQSRIADLFEHRHLFVRHHLSAAERVLLGRLTRSDRRLRALRAIMDEVYRLFDRRCRTDTALRKLTKLRQRVRRFRSLGKTLDKLHSPNLEKALTFLDDKLLPATSNVVERGNRRLRKMQKTIYRVRKQETLQGRLALDLLREQQASGRQDTLASLHQTRQ
jgi:hypothetical protein